MDDSTSDVRSVTASIVDRLGRKPYCLSHIISQRVKKEYNLLWTTFSNTLDMFDSNDIGL